MIIAYTSKPFWLATPGHEYLVYCRGEFMGISGVNAVLMNRIPERTRVRRNGRPIAAMQAGE